MTLLKDVLAELFGMFVADARLTLAILALVAFTAVLVTPVHLNPLVCGLILLSGCLITLFAAVLAATRNS
ncbi:hypothetical protein [Roseibium aggregatum]|uniref:hypothetical protein n=1 Tax=Roseibium aggregatum TaxID=187304 RepID=UPI001E420CBF|nr:hypothetical protein [Roseibium aggregatum]UES36720.1 hypothetical protein GFC08_01975 [Roseibium aggregatum]